MMIRYTILLCIMLMQVISGQMLSAQMITGVWQGRIGTQKIELKLISKGDSLTGTSYYYSSNGTYSRYSVKGYFNPDNQTVVWWDDELIEQKNNSPRFLSAQSLPLLSEADFNCPGGGKMMLDGHSGPIGKSNQTEAVHLTKAERSVFEDEWDFVIDNFLVGSNDPVVIAETEQHWKTIAKKEPAPEIIEKPVKKKPEPAPSSTSVIAKKNTDKTSGKTITKDSIPQLPEQKSISLTNPVTDINQKFETRKKQLLLEIPLAGDSIEVHFYDNAEVDGDSISLFLNNVLLYEHIRLTDKPFTLKLAVKALNDQNDLVMVAENLGSIPPNTSYMIAYVNGQTLKANLESTEKSSAMIRLLKPQ